MDDNLVAVFSFSLKNTVQYLKVSYFGKRYSILETISYPTTRLLLKLCLLKSMLKENHQYS